MDEQKWTPVAEGLPEEGVEVEVQTPAGDQRTLIYRRQLWWLPDGSMYVYFTPVVWRPIQRWVPKVGDWVVYRAFPESTQPEDGEVVEVRGDLVMVRYGWASSSVKATPLANLAPGGPR